jgi:hypothetical protein
MMERYENFWKGVQGSEALETFGFEGYVEPEPVNVNVDTLVELFKAGYQQFSPLWKDIFCKDCFKEIQKLSKSESASFHLPTEVWVQILYELAATFHLWSFNRVKLLALVTPLYFARVASFVKQSWDMSSEEAETLVEEQAMRFEEQKDYLISVWNEKSEEKQRRASSS